MMCSVLACNIYTIISVWDSVCCCSRKNQFTIVPILVGSLSPDKEQQYGAIFSSYLASPENLFVVSSDFCHWGQSVMLKWKQHPPCLFCIQFVCTFHLLIWFCLFSPLPCLFGIEFVCPFTLVIWCSVCFSSYPAYFVLSFSPYPAYLVFSLFPTLLVLFGVDVEFGSPLTLLICSFCFSPYPAYLVFALFLPLPCLFGVHLCGNRNKNVYQIQVGDKVICVEVEMEEFTKTWWMLARSF